jgi:hypothetical protein
LNIKIRGPLYHYGNVVEFRLYANGKVYSESLRIVKEEEPFRKQIEQGIFQRVMCAFYEEEIKT